MDTSKLVGEFIELAFKLKDDINAPGPCMGLKEKARRIQELKNHIESKIKEALDNQIDQALFAVDRYSEKYNAVQNRNASSVPHDGGVFYSRELKQNLDATDKMVILLLKLVRDDIEDLKDRG